MDDLKSMWGWFLILVAMCATAVAAPFVAFAVKAGWLRVPVDRDTNVFYIAFNALWIAGGFVIALMFLTIFWHIGIAAWFKPLGTVFVLYYRTPGCTNFCEITAWWNMLGEAWPYFLATTITLFARACGDWSRSREVSEDLPSSPLKRRSVFSTSRVLRFLLPPIIAAVAFLIFLYGDEIITTFQLYGLGDGVALFFRKWMHEIASIAEPIIALMNGESFGGWLQNEVAKLHVSLFKLSALYPKVFWVFILFGLVTTIREA